MVSLQNTNNVTSIADYAFQGCSSVKSFSSNNITSISNITFQDTSFEEVNLPNLTGIPAGHWSGPKGSFIRCSRLKKVYIPKVTSIGSYVFMNDYSLEDVSVGRLTSVGEYAFQNTGRIKIESDALTSVAGGTGSSFASSKITRFSATNLTGIPDGNWNGPIGVFSNCTELEYADIRKVTSIGTYAFINCRKLSSIRLDSLVYIGGDGDNLNGVFRGCNSLSEFSAPNLIKIGNASFYGLSNLTSFTGIYNVTSIGLGAFYNSGLNGNVQFNLLTSIPTHWVNNSGTFAYTRITGFFSESLVSVVINGSIAIGNSARPPFWSCTSLKTVMFGSSFNAICDGTFWGCSSLATLVIKASTAPSVGGANVFNGCGQQTFSIFVPMDSVSVYKSASGWSSWSSRIKGYLEADELPDDNTDADLYFIGDLFYRWENNQWVLKNDPETMNV